MPDLTTPITPVTPEAKKVKSKKAKPKKIKHPAIQQAATKSIQSGWTIEDSINLYGVDRWSNGYFGVAANGNLTITAPGIEQQPVELLNVVEGLKQRGHDMPVMLRIENLLSDRVKQLNEAFARAISQSEYQGDFRAVFPIKVNQQHHVVSEIARFGDPYGHGLEAGSKAELLIAMSTKRSKESLIICNGYKDEEFVDLGLQATCIGFKCFFVLETPHELRLILERAKHWGIKPLIGVRLKLSTTVDGHWAGDSGDRSLFGLSTRQLIEVVDHLRESNQLDCLQLLHFHLGSQIPNIRNIRDGLREACRFYIDLVKEGAALRYLDLGGGLAVDYDGSSSIEAHSRNYDLDEYCVDIVETVMASLDPHDVAHPTLVTESGRWTVAPMSVLLFNVLSVSHFDPTPLGELDQSKLSESTCSLLESLSAINERRLQENYNDAIYFRDQMQSEFRAGDISLRERALAENICLTILHKIAAMVLNLKKPAPELVKMCESLSDIYYGNFSVFQSLPDAWAIEQIFPVMPLHRLNEKPTRTAIIADLTCDCDGKLNKFAHEDGISPTIPLHEFQEDDDYIIGVFLVGSYQETLGDLHNLFGDTNVVSIGITDDGNIEFLHELAGDTISDVLSYVEYQPKEMYSRFRTMAEEAVRDGSITVDQRREMLRLFEESLRGYTYFEQ